MPKGLVLWASHMTNGAEHLSSASARLMARAEHELQDMGEVVRAQGFRTCAAHQGPKKRKRVPNGPCYYQECQRDTKTTQFFCPSCREGKGAFYYL